MRSEILARLASPSFDLDCYPDQERDFGDLLGRFLNEGKSGSVLILGATGAGKTTFVNRCLLNGPKKKYTRVTLQGFLLANDVAAVREMARQLETEVYSDSDDEERKVSVGDTVKNLVGRTCFPVLVILEQFDRFASHRSLEKQHFLYSLLDLTHNRVSPVLVVGISSKLDSLDMLEKRIRSRISQKPLLLSNQWSFEKYLEYAKSMLTMSKGKGASQWNESVKAALSDSPVKSYFQYHYDLNPSLQRLRQYLAVVVSLCDEENSLSKAGFRKAHGLFTLDSRHVLLQGLSNFEICLVLAACHCLRIYGDIEELNFELIYKEYCQLSRSCRRNVDNAPSFPKPVALQVFDRLCQLGVFTVTKTRKSKSHLLRRFAPFRIQFDPNTIKKHVERGSYPTYVNEWLQFQ